jgi:DNA polymerase-3 subunit epsilon
MPRISDMTLTSFDTETTGLDTSTDRVVEFGAVTHQVGGEPTITHHYIDPGVPIPEEASNVHGITGATVFGCPSFGEIAPTLERCLSMGALVGYNASVYDASILNAEFARAGNAFRIDPASVLDPLIFARWHLRGHKSRKLGEMCAFFDITLDQAHTAVADATATLQLTDRMVVEGMIPDDIDEALEEQGHFRQYLDAESRQWGRWLYRDRLDGHIRMGSGRSVGHLLSQADKSYLAWIISNADYLHEGAKHALVAEIRKRNGIRLTTAGLLGRGGWP